MSSHRLSLAQQIALIEETAPVDIDPEDVDVQNPDAESALVEQGAAREHYFQVGPSTLRKQYDSVSEPKYEGTKTTRKEMMEASSDQGSESGEEGEAGFSGGGVDHEIVSEEDSDDEEEEQDGEAASTENEDEEKDDAQSQRTNAPKPILTKEIVEEDLTSTLRQKRGDDIKKGKAVSRQIALWDSLLDTRIHLQKSLMAVNRIPKPGELEEYAGKLECQESINKMLFEAACLSDELFDLQEYLLTSNESITLPPRKRRKIERFDERTEYVDWLRDATSDISALEERYHSHLIQTLAKWSAKIQAVSPNVLLPSTRNAFSFKGSQSTKAVLQVIDDTLVDHEKLLARTQVRQGKGCRIGAPPNEDIEPDLEIFDDTDFYQQLLRSVIDSRGNGAGDDWSAIQKQKKVKKNVDTKASKGRKLRYEVHEKLQHFMVPVPVIGGWHEEQIDELFASIMGNVFETNGGPDDQDALRQRDDEINQSLKGGFRVYG